MIETMPAADTVATSEIPSLVIPIQDGKLILPTVSVAEMLPYKKPKWSDIETAQVSSWFLGHVLWRGIKVPMISYEAINGGNIPAAKGVSQMAILNNTGVSSQLPFLCFPTQGIPHISRVMPNAIKEDVTQTAKPYDEMNILVNDEPATIPNVKKLEQAVVTLLGL